MTYLEAAIEARKVRRHFETFLKSLRDCKAREDWRDDQIEEFDRAVGSIVFPGAIEEDRGLAPDHIGTLQVLGRRIEIALHLSVVTAGNTPLNMSIWAEGTLEFYIGTAKEAVFEIAINHLGQFSVGAAAAATWDGDASNPQEVQKAFLKLLQTVANQFRR
jgi:hypothetical protein